jgi:hypothetical protein
VLTFLDTLPSGMYDLPKGGKAAAQGQKQAASY